MSTLKNERELIELVKKGSMSAFKTLVEKYEDPISNVVIGLLGKTPESEEVAQEVFLKFFYKIDHFRFDSSLKTYLTRIAINLSLNELKKRQKIKSRIVYSDEISMQGISTSENNFELKEVVEKALQELNISLRSVVVLRMIEGYSTKETAQLLKVPVGTVLSRLARAQEKLKPILKKYI